MSSLLCTSVVLLTVIEVGGTAAVTCWAHTEQLQFLVLGVGLFSALGGMLALSISINPHMNTVNALWQSISIASVTVVSRIVFEEPLTYLQLTGVVLATLASLCFVV